jgi:SAM-dependent methyltransferase
MPRFRKPVDQRRQPDVPSPIDLRSMVDARQWAESAMVKRPWREEFFDTIEQQLPSGDITVLDLGSGPGFLAQRLLRTNRTIRYVAIDFSAAMHELAGERLGLMADRVRFIEADFKQAGWAKDLPSFHAVVTMQAVHELRHKRHAPNLYATVRSLLRSGGVFLMCDHFAGEGGMVDGELFMTPDEHADALKAAGFCHPVLLLKRGGLVLFRADR